jgi:hypothetical protein
MHPRIQTILAAVALAATAAHAAERSAYQSRYSPSCPADLTNDGVVDDSDFVQFADAYNTLDCADPAMPAGCPADLNADLFVDDSDFVLFATAYNELLCPPGEVILRDSIGPDNTLTNGGRVLPITTTNSGGVVYVSFSVAPSESITLKEVAVVVASPTQVPVIQWGVFDYQVRIWSSPEARSASPNIGDLMNCQFPFPSNLPSNGGIPPVFGSAVGSAPFNQAVQSHLLKFDVLGDANASCAPAMLHSGGIYPIAIQAIRPPQDSSTVGVVTSLQTGEIDVRYTLSNPSGTPVTAFSTPELPLTGRVGYRVVGLRQ